MASILSARASGRTTFKKWSPRNLRAIRGRSPRGSSKGCRSGRAGRSASSTLSTTRPGRWTGARNAPLFQREQGNRSFAKTGSGLTEGNLKHPAFHFVSFRFVSFRFVSFRFVSFHACRVDRERCARMAGKDGVKHSWYYVAEFETDRTKVSQGKIFKTTPVPAPSATFRSYVSSLQILQIAPVFRSICDTSFWCISGSR